MVPTRPVLSHSADAVRAGGLVFVAGILPVDRDGTLVGADDAGAQASFVLGELASILAAAGCGVADVVKLGVFLTDLDDEPAVASSRRAAFGEATPVAATVAVSGLAVPGARIEIDAVAVRP